MKKLVIVLVMLMVSLTLIGCKETTTETYPGDEIILDKNIERGIGILGVESITDLREIHRYFRYSDTVSKNIDPLWRLMQWGTRYNFRESGVETIDGDFFVISDSTKEFRINPTTGEYSLNTFTALEYPTPRIFNQPWLHFATEQIINDPSRIDEMANIWVDLDFEITQCENLMGTDFNPDLHTALFQWVFIVRNENMDSLDYGNYIWVNIPYFDARYDFNEEDAFLDFGKEDKSDTFIYSASSREILSDMRINVGERRRVTIDLKAYIIKALEKIQNLPANLNSDHPILLNTELYDLRVESFYIGWEIPGTFNASATIYANSLKYERN